MKENLSYKDAKRVKVAQAKRLRNETDQGYVERVNGGAVKGREHTPGPWIITENGSNGFVTVEGPGRVVVHQDDLGSIPDEAIGKDAMVSEMIGNACLIEAAPEMLEFVHKYLDSESTTSGLDQEAKRILAKVGRHV